ncbi:MAG: PIN domain-containing protein [Candidatus Dormibacteraeota bacterium]|nr:PIN domain-containing protein [Candidatus Dormibacteraeota bacterium]
MTFLLDANVLIALVVADHVHHEAAEDWLVSTTDGFASCPLTQGSLVRLLLREGQAATTATGIVQALSSNVRHEFWPDDVTYSEVRMVGVVGHRQVTDAYLAQLARAHRGRLASFDHGLAELHADVVELIPT